MEHSLGETCKAKKENNKIIGKRLRRITLDGVFRQSSLEEETFRLRSERPKGASCVERDRRTVQADGGGGPSGNERGLGRHQGRGEQREGRQGRKRHKAPS